MNHTNQTARMKILVVAAGEPWPLDGGGRLHLYHVLSQLTRHTEVTLLLPRPSRYREQLPAALRVITLPQHWGECTADPPSPASMPRVGKASHSPAIPLILRLVRRHFGHNKMLEAWLRRHATRREFDVVMLNGAVMGQHVEACRVPVVWNPQDELILPTLRAAQYSPYAHWFSALKRSALYAAYERYAARKAAATIYVSRLDAVYARRCVGDARLEVVQNGVDFDAFAPVEEPPDPGSVTFIGSLEFPPNVDAISHFVATAWPYIHAGDERRRLRIVGRRPTAAVRALAETPGVEVIPDVPDVRPYLARASVVIVPIRTGGGLKNKVLEACAMRRPVVAHPRALMGLSARVGHDVLSASRPENMIRCVTRLLENPDHADRIARNGYTWVTRAHSWETTGQRFLEILSSAAGAPIDLTVQPTDSQPSNSSSTTRFRATEPVTSENRSWNKPRAKAGSSEPISSSASC